MPWLLLLWNGASAAPPPVQDTATGDTAWYQKTGETADTGTSITDGTTGTGDTGQHDTGPHDTGPGGSGGSGGSGGTGTIPTDLPTDATTDTTTDVIDDTGGEDDKNESCGCDVPGAPAGAALGIGWAAALVARGRQSAARQRASALSDTGSTEKQE